MNSNNKLTIVQHFQLKGNFQPFKRIDLYAYNITNMGIQGYISHYKCIEAYHNIKFKQFNTQWRIQGVKGVFSPPPFNRRIHTRHGKTKYDVKSSLRKYYFTKCQIYLYCLKKKWSNIFCSL